MEGVLPGKSRRRATKVYRIGANPEGRKVGRPRHGQPPALRSWPLDRRSRRTSALPYPPPRPWLIVVELARSGNRLKACRFALGFPLPPRGTSPRMAATLSTPPEGSRHGANVTATRPSDARSELESPADWTSAWTLWLAAPIIAQDSAQDGPPRESHSTLMRARRWLVKLLLAACSTLVALLLGEGICQLCGLEAAPRPAWHTNGNAPAVSDPLMALGVGHDRLGWCLTAGGSYRAAGIEHAPLVTVDRFGYRTTPGSDEEADTPILVVLGDSFAFAGQVADNETLASRVSQALAERGRTVRVINAGVPGYNTLQSTMRLEDACDLFGARVRGAVYVMCGNDYEENAVADLRWPLRAPILIRRGGEYVEWQPPDTMGHGQPIDGWWPPRIARPGSRLGDLRYRSGFYRYFELTVRRVGPHLSAPEELRRRRMDGQELGVWHAWATMRPEGREVTRAALRRIGQFCDRNGLWLLVVPSRIGTLEPHESDDRVNTIIAEDCSTAGLRYVEVPYAGSSADLSARYVDGTLEGHWNSRATQVVADAVVPLVESRMLHETAVRGTPQDVAGEPGS